MHVFVVAYGAFESEERACIDHDMSEELFLGVRSPDRVDQRDVEESGLTLWSRCDGDVGEAKLDDALNDFWWEKGWAGGLGNCGR